MARAVRPCLPITRPRSLGANREFKHGLPTFFDRINRNLRGIVDQSLGDLLDQDPHVPGWRAFIFFSQAGSSSHRRSITDFREVG